MKKKSFSKREIRALFRKIIYSSYKMSNLPYEDKFYKEKDDRRYKVFIENNALEYIMRIHTDWAFGQKSKNKKYYDDVFENKKPDNKNKKNNE